MKGGGEPGWLGVKQPEMKTDALSLQGRKRRHILQLRWESCVKRDL